MQDDRLDQDCIPPPSISQTLDEASRLPLGTSPLSTPMRRSEPIRRPAYLGRQDYQDEVFSTPHYTQYCIASTGRRSAFDCLNQNPPPYSSTSSGRGRTTNTKPISASILRTSNGLGERSKNSSDQKYEISRTTRVVTFKEDGRPDILWNASIGYCIWKNHNDSSPLSGQKSSETVKARSYDRWIPSPEWPDLEDVDDDEEEEIFGMRTGRELDEIDRRDIDKKSSTFDCKAKRHVLETIDEEVKDFDPGDVAEVDIKRPSGDTQLSSSQIVPLLLP